MDHTKDALRYMALETAWGDWFGYRFVTKDNYVELADCYCVADTAKALLINHAGKEFWVPRSVVIEEGSDVEEKHDTGNLVIKRWFYDKLKEERDLE